MAGMAFNLWTPRVGPGLRSAEKLRYSLLGTPFAYILSNVFLEGLCMLKKRILLLGLLLVLSIAGQVLLRPCLGDTRTPAAGASAEEKPSRPDLLSAESTFSKDTPELQSELLRQFFYMIGVVVLIGVGAWFVCRKLSCGWTGTKGHTIQIGETARLGPRKAVHLIHVGKKTFLVGSTSDHLCLLADVSETIGLAKDQAHE